MMTEVSSIESQKEKQRVKQLTIHQLKMVCKERTESCYCQTVSVGKKPIGKCNTPTTYYCFNYVIN